MDFTNDQKKAFDILVSGKNVFVTGGAGTGKSYLITEFVKYCNENNKNIMVCAPTGIAALNINGATIHSVFGLSPIPIIEDPYIVPETIKQTDVLLIDEISMVRVDIFDYIAKTLLIAGKKIQFVVVGDFYQLPPVLTNDDAQILCTYYNVKELGGAYAFQSKYWKILGLKTVFLNEVVRQQDADFVNALNQVKVGDVRGIEYINSHSAKEKIEKAITVTGTRREVSDINQEELDKLPGDSITYTIILSQIIGL